jgi:hypothetical protein
MIEAKDITDLYIKAVTEYNHTEYPLDYGLVDHIGVCINDAVSKEINQMSADLIYYKKLNLKLRHKIIELTDKLKA